MKFPTRSKAQTFIDLNFSRAQADRHSAVRSRYWCMERFRWIRCWTVVLDQ